jgi:hypothetical protein
VQTELQQLQDMLATTQLQQGTDRVIWKRSATQIFTVKAAYQFIAVRLQTMKFCSSIEIKKKSCDAKLVAPFSIFLIAFYSKTYNKTW